MAVTKAQVEKAKALLLQALEEGYDPQAMRAALDPRFRPPVWKVLLSATASKPVAGFDPSSSVTGRLVESIGEDAG